MKTDVNGWRRRNEGSMTDATKTLKNTTAMGKDLNHRQERFVQEFLVDLNATQAAIRAGYSEKTADSAGPRLLRNVRVRAAIESGKKALMERVGVSQEHVIKKLWAVHDASMITSKDGGFANPAAANRSLELIGKHGGMFTEDHTAGEVIIQVNVHPHGERDG